MSSLKINMNLPSFNEKPIVLVAPLDWGLGHATRCIPIIRQLLQQNCGVILAGNEKIKALLGKEFPQLEFLHLPGYNVNYGKSRWETMGKILLQIPKILQAIDKENLWLEEVVEKYRINAVISDNRYGLHNENIYSVFITHQLQIQTPAGSMIDSVMQKFNYDQVNQFNECWVPDVDGAINLAGALSHPETKPDIPLHYIGSLSRFNKTSNNIPKHLLVLLSGPEPQRTMLEELMLQELKTYTEPVILVRGLPESNEKISAGKNITIANHLTAYALQKAMEEAIFVISRCGYSTVMDVMKLEKKSILIPTPGQTEQEYLGEHLMQSGAAFCVDQSKFTLQAVLELADQFNYYFQEFNDDDALQNAVTNLLQKLQKTSQQSTVE